MVNTAEPSEPSPVKARVPSERPGGVVAIDEFSRRTTLEVHGVDHRIVVGVLPHEGEERPIGRRRMALLHR